MSRLRVPAHLVAASLPLVSDSALSFCTDYDLTDTGIVVTPRWPVSSFSSGEKELWKALRELAETGYLPDVDESHLDDRNRQAVESSRGVLEAVTSW